MHFTSDNALGAAPRILDALVRTNAGPTPAYGADASSQRAIAMLQALFETECAVFLVATGTAANALALAAVTPPWGAVFCHEDAHVNRDECGAPEFFGNGAKLVPLRGAGAKVTPDAVAAKSARHARGVVHQSQPAAITISQATEAGTTYTCAEIAALAATARAEKLALHMDGARFANALVTLGCTPAEMTWKAGVDILSFGATKNGALACEAVLFFNPAHAGSFAYRRKRAGHLVSKGRFLGAQMEAYLEGGHWLDLARHANACALLLEEGLKTLPGVRLPWTRGANEVFAMLPRRIDAALKAAGAVYYEWQADDVAPGGGEVFARFVTSFATRAEDVEAFLAIARKA